MPTPAELPLDFKKQLLALAERLPEKSRGNFVRRVVDEVGGLATDHPRTVAYSIGGWLLGEILDNLLCIPVPFTETVVELTADHASTLIGVAGAFVGFSEDRNALAVRQQINRVISLELSRSLAAI